MSQHDPELILRQLLDHAREAAEMARGRTREDLDSNRMLNLALVRLMEVIGEAATRMPRDERAKLPQLPWRELTSQRNRLIHGYDQVDFDTLWQIIVTDLPVLIESLDRMLRERSGSDG